MNPAISLAGLIYNIFLTSNNVLWNSNSMDTPADKLFSDSTIDLIRQSWSWLNTDMEEIGHGILMKIFSKYPTYLQKFKKFKDVPMTELKNNKDFLKHAGRVGAGLRSVVKNLDKPDTLVPILKDLGKRHAAYYIQAEHLLNSEPLIHEYLMESFGSQATEQTDKAWKEVLHAGIQVMIEGQS